MSSFVTLFVTLIKAESGLFGFLKSPAKQRGRDFAVMLQSLNELGYAVEWRVINAAEYGMPQRRRRVFFIG